MTMTVGMKKGSFSLRYIPQLVSVTLPGTVDKF